MLATMYARFGIRARLAVTAVFVCLFVGSVFSFNLTSLHAQEGMGVRIQPTTIDERADPGQVIEGVLSVTNQNGGRQTFSISTRSITGVDDDGRPSFADDSDWTDEFTAAAWLEPLQTSITLDVNETGEIPYRISVPSDAAPGSYFAALFVTRAADTVEENGAGVGFNVASLLSLRVNGEAFEDLLFREFYTGKMVYSASDVDFTLRLENAGNVHERPRGIIAITDMLGRPVGQITVNDKNGAVLPRSDRLFTASWNTENFAIGKYTAQASIGFGDTAKQTIVRETTFWILPMREIGIVLGGMAAVVLLFVLSIRTYIRRTLRKAGHSVSATARAQETTSLARRMLKTLTWMSILILLGCLGVVAFFA